MNDIELSTWCVTRRTEIDKEMENLANEANPEKLPTFKALLKINNALIELFWEIMVYRERCGLTPIAHPHK